MLQPVYFFHFMAVGVAMPFFPPYLRGLGLSGRQIAALLSIVPVLNMVVPLVWAWLADRTHRHTRVLVLACAGAFVGTVPLALAGRFGTLFVSYLFFALFSVGIGGLVDAVAIARVRAGAHYGRIRVWGSFGYMLSSIGVGIWLTARGGLAADPLVPWLISAGYLGLLLVSLQMRGTGEPARRPHMADVRALLSDRRFRLLLIVAPLHWIGCAPYNVFFGIFMRDRGLPARVLGVALATGVAAEMLVLLVFARLARRFRIESLLAASFAATALRWALMPLCQGSTLLIVLQLFHGLTFGLYWGSGIALVATSVPPHLRATGQALYVVAMLGVGNAFGYVATGLVYDVFGRVDRAFFAAAVLELVPLGLMLWRGRAGGTQESAAKVRPGDGA